MLVSPDHAAQEDREPERLASGRAGGVGDDPIAVARLLDGRSDGVVLVREPDCGLRRYEALRMPPTMIGGRGLLKRLGPDVVGLGPLAVDLGELPLELVDALANREERKSVGQVIGLEPPRADPELDPSGRDVVDRDDRLGEHRRRAGT